MAIVKSSVFQRLQLAKEAVPGTRLAANRRMPNQMVQLNPMVDIKEYTGQGFKAPNVTILNKEWTAIACDGPATFDELTWYLASVFGLVSPTLADSAYTWNFTPSLSNPDTPATYTMEQGDQITGYRTGYGLLTDFDIAITRDEVKNTAKGIGQQLDVGFNLTNIDELQTVTITGTPTGGSFALTVGGQTATVPYNSTAGAVKTLIEALSSVGSGNSTVTGGPGPGTPWAITLTGTAANQTITVDGTLLSGGSSPAIANVITGGGGAATVGNHPIGANMIDLFIDPTFGAIGTTRVPRGYTAEFGITGRWGPDWILDTTYSSFADYVELKPSFTLKMSMESNATSDAFVAQYRANTTKYVRFQATGPLIGVSSRYLLQLDVPFRVKGNSGFKDLAGVWTADWDFTPMSDATANYFVSAKLVNSTAAL